MTEGFIWDYDDRKTARVASAEETVELLEEIDTVFRTKIANLVYSHKVSCCMVAYHLLNLFHQTNCRQLLSCIVM